MIYMLTATSFAWFSFCQYTIWNIIFELSAAKFIVRREQFQAYIGGLGLRIIVEMLTNKGAVRSKKKEKRKRRNKWRASRNLQDPVGDDAFIGLDA